jgi:hypothetical protein
MTAALDRLLEGYYNARQQTPSNPGGLGNYGHVVNLPALLEDIGTAIGVDLVGMAEAVAQHVLDAEAAAASALNAPGTLATSSSVVTLAVGERVFNVGNDRLFSKAQLVVAADDNNAANFAVGRVKSYIPPYLTVDVSEVEGPDVGDDLNDWVIALTASGGVPLTRKVTGGGLATQSGDGSLSSDVVVTVTKAATADVRAGTNDTKAVTPKGLFDAVAPVALVDGATVAWNAATAPSAYLLLTANRLIGSPTNLKDGQDISILMQQDTTGGWKPTWHAIFDWGEAGEPTPNPGANKFCLAVGRYYALTSKIHMNFRQGV